MSLWPDTSWGVFHAALKKEVSEETGGKTGVFIAPGSRSMMHGWEANMCTATALPSIFVLSGWMHLYPIGNFSEDGSKHTFAGKGIV